MNETEHLLVCLAEECNEVAQRVSKALRFGLDEVQPGQELTNEARIVHELIDIDGVIGMLQDRGHLRMPSGGLFSELLELKRAKVERFLEYARERGAVGNDEDAALHEALRAAIERGWAVYYLPEAGVWQLSPWATTNLTIEAPTLPHAIEAMTAADAAGKGAHVTTAPELVAFEPMILPPNAAKVLDELAQPDASGPEAAGQKP